jgi:hypothetical protein
MLSYAKQLIMMLSHAKQFIVRPMAAEARHRRCADLELGAPDIARLGGTRYS